VAARLDRLITIKREGIAMKSKSHPGTVRKDLPATARKGLLAIARTTASKRVSRITAYLYAQTATKSSLKMNLSINLNQIEEVTSSNLTKDQKDLHKIVPSTSLQFVPSRNFYVPSSPRNSRNSSKPAERRDLIADEAAVIFKTLHTKNKWRFRSRVSSVEITTTKLITKMKTIKLRLRLSARSTQQSGSLAN
jgi:hypothetical protein